MNDDRDLIFSNIRKALEPLPERAPYPEWDAEMPICREHPEFAERWDLYAYKLQQVNGTPLRGLKALGEWLVAAGQTFGYCDPKLVDEVRAEPAFAGITLETEFDRARVDEYLFGITLASGAIAETGTVILKDKETSARLGALAPWTHVAILRPERLLASTAEAIASLGDDPSVIWATGPSKTADVEGILIEGVHGPGTQICCLV